VADAALLTGAAAITRVSEYQITIVVAGLALYPMLIYLLSKLLLWPVGVLTGRGAVTPGRSWTLMRGALRAWILANLITILPLVAAAIPVSILAPQATTSSTLIVVSAILGATWSLLGQAMAAVIFAHRVDAGERLAAMFD
jgi:hypothetical protein